VPLNFHVTDTPLGGIIPSDGIECAIDQSTHNELFQEPNITADSYPFLDRFRNYYDDAYVEHEALESLISEIEQASIHFKHGSYPKKFLGSLHALCCVAWARDAYVSAFCD
jgi:hypothetical protein